MLGAVHVLLKHLFRAHVAGATYIAAASHNCAHAVAGRPLGSRQPLGVLPAIQVILKMSFRGHIASAAQLAAAANAVTDIDGKGLGLLLGYLRWLCLAGFGRQMYEQLDGVLVSDNGESNCFDEVFVGSDRHEVAIVVFIAKNINIRQGKLQDNITG